MSPVKEGKYIRKREKEIKKVVGKLEALRKMAKGGREASEKSSKMSIASPGPDSRSKQRQQDNAGKSEDDEMGLYDDSGVVSVERLRDLVKNKNVQPVNPSVPAEMEKGKTKGSKGGGGKGQRWTVLPASRDDPIVKITKFKNS